MRLRGIFLCLIASPALAQAGRDALIPRELAEALISVANYGPNRPELIVGSLPEPLAPKFKMPAGAKVLGGMRLDDASTGVLLVDGALNAVADQFHRDLLGQGWEVALDPMADFRNEFIDPPSTDRRMTKTGLPEMYCGRAGTLMVRYHPDGFQRTQVILSSTGVNQCARNRDMMFRSRMGGMDEPKRPKLVNHPAARGSPGACLDFNMGMGDRKTDLGSQLSPSDILSHYGKQLADSGWVQLGTTVAAIFQKRDSTGALIEYQMLVHSPAAGAGCRSVRTDLNGTIR